MLILRKLWPIMKNYILHTKHYNGKDKSPNPFGHVVHKPGKRIGTHPAEYQSCHSRHVRKGIQPDEVEEHEINDEQHAAQQDHDIAAFKNSAYTFRLFTLLHGRASSVFGPPVSNDSPDPTDTGSSEYVAAY